MAIGFQILIGAIIPIILFFILFLVSLNSENSSLFTTLFLVFFMSLLLPALFIDHFSLFISANALKNIFIMAFTFYLILLCSMGIGFVISGESDDGTISIIIASVIYVALVGFFSIIFVSAYKDVTIESSTYTEIIETPYDVISNKNGTCLYLVTSTDNANDYYVFFYSDPDNQDNSTLYYKKIPSSKIAFKEPVEETSKPCIIENQTKTTTVEINKKNEQNESYSSEYFYIVYLNNPIDYITVVGSPVLSILN